MADKNETVLHATDCDYCEAQAVHIIDSELGTDAVCQEHYTAILEVCEDVSPNLAQRNGFDADAMYH